MAFLKWCRLYFKYSLINKLVKLILNQLLMSNNKEYNQNLFKNATMCVYCRGARNYGFLIGPNLLWYQMMPLVPLIRSATILASLAS